METEYGKSVNSRKEEEEEEEDEDGYEKVCGNP
jgi:hypothetical protein